MVLNPYDLLAVTQLADRAEAKHLDPEDHSGEIKALISQYGWDHDTWIAVCQELQRRSGKPLIQVNSGQKKSWVRRNISSLRYGLGKRTIKA